MQKYILKRLLQLLPTVLVIVIVTWGLIRLAPGDPALALAGEMATPEMIEALRITYGLNKPLQEQLRIYLTKVFQGDLGYSLTYGIPVLRIIIMRLPATLLLMISANVVSFGIGVPLGAYLGSKYPSKRDSAISIVALVSYSVPIFFSGLLLITIFGFYLRWFPMAGMVSMLIKKEGWNHVVDVLWHATLPILTLSIVFLPQYLLVTRAGVIEIMQKDFIKTARYLGLRERSIYYKHALRNTLISVVTLLGIRLSLSLTGAIMTETVFAWPGMGKLLYDAILARDYPLLSGLFLVSAMLVVVMSLITDIIIGFLDPQVRFG